MLQKLLRLFYTKDAIYSGLLYVNNKLLGI